MTTFTPDDFAAGLATFLKPGGVPVGAIESISNEYPDLPYGGVVPAVWIFPEKSADALFGGRSALQQGNLALIYQDSIPDQQGVPLATIMTALWSNYAAIKARIRSDMTWGGVVSTGGYHIQITNDPRGPMKTEDGTMWVELDLLIAYKGLKELF